MTMKDLPHVDITSLLPERPEVNWPGCTLAILRGDEVVQTFHHGSASVEHGVPIGPETNFRIASVTKQFLCAGVVALSDEGKLELDAPLGRYLPDLKPAVAAVTLRQAMSNTSGIRDHFELFYTAGGGLSVPHRLQASRDICMAQESTNFEPGSQYLYSNANFLLLSKVAEDAAGEPLEAYLDHRFFAPLGMTRTALRPGQFDVIPHAATGYVDHGDGILRRGRMTQELWGEGSAWSCVEDLVTWLRYCRADPDGIIARMRAPQVFTTGDLSGYGLGLFVEEWRGQARTGHQGLWPGFRAEIMYYPQHDIGLVCLSNLSTLEPSALNRQILAELLGPDLPPRATDIDPALWTAAETAGPWYDPDSLTLVGFTGGTEDPQLSAYGGQGPLTALDTTRLAPDVSRSEIREIDLSQAAQGQITLVRSSGQIVPLAPLSAHAPDLGHDALPGHWYCPETDAHLHIAPTGDGFEVRTPGFRGHDWVTTPIDGGLLKIEEFSGPWPRCFYLHAERSEAGDTILIVNGPRVRRLVYAPLPG